jgi:hypothetical protein
MFEIRRREAKKKSVMPAEAGIHGWWAEYEKPGFRLSPE